VSDSSYRTRRADRWLKFFMFPPSAVVGSEQCPEASRAYRSAKMRSSPSGARVWTGVGRCQRRIHTLGATDARRWTSTRTKILVDFLRSVPEARTRACAGAVTVIGDDIHRSAGPAGDCTSRPRALTRLQGAHLSSRTAGLPSSALTALRAVWSGKLESVEIKRHRVPGQAAEAAPTVCTGSVRSQGGRDLRGVGFAAACMGQVVSVGERFRFCGAWVTGSRRLIFQ